MARFKRIPKKKEHDVIKLIIAKMRTINNIYKNKKPTDI